MATPTLAAQQGLQEKVVVEGPTGQNLLVAVGMHTIPRVGELFKIGGEQYTVKNVEHSISDDLMFHLIWIYVQ